MRSLVNRLQFISLSLAASFSAMAGVNVNNGNFYIAYTDLYLPTRGLNIDVTRTYNSRSNYVKGYFGVGWSSEIEGYLNFEKSDVVYYEGGGGNVVRFNSSGKSQWVNNVYGPQSIKKIGSNYQLLAASGKSLIFNEAGKLAKIADRNQNYLDLVYAKDGRLEMLKDNTNNQIKVSWGNFGSFGRITALEAGDLKARYKYSPTGDLLEAVGADAVPFAYEYDDEHNMSKIAYKDGNYKEMKYNKSKDWIISFRDKDAMVTSYNYISDTLDPENKFGTVVNRQQEGSKDKESSRFWYEFRKRKDGSRYNYRSVTWIRGQVTETILTECCGTPQAISQWRVDEVPSSDLSQKWTLSSADKKTTFFEYYNDGLLKKKTSSDGLVTALTYDEKLGKVSTVTKDGRKIAYKYDTRGNLAEAYDSANTRNLFLKYSLEGQLVSIQEAKFIGNKQTNSLVVFNYSAGKLDGIKEKTMDGKDLGVIKIKYDPNGVVTQIQNKEGRTISSEREMAMAQRVATTFQNLLEVVQPAGVTLTPEG